MFERLGFVEMLAAEGTRLANEVCATPQALLAVLAKLGERALQVLLAFGIPQRRMRARTME